MAKLEAGTPGPTVSKVAASKATVGGAVPGAAGASSAAGTTAAAGAAGGSAVPNEKGGRTPRSRLRKFLWGSAVLVLAVGGAYVGGRLQSHARIEELARELEATRRQVEELRGKETAQLKQLGELEARRQIHLGILAFDQNNFGIAQDHLRKAAVLLESPAMQPDSALSALGVALRTLELSPTLDLVSQREALVQLANKFDGLRPPTATSR
jgi:hypothetical protein